MMETSLEMIVECASGFAAEYQGINTIFWAVLNEESKAGSTIHFMEKDVDAGDIILKKEISIITEEVKNRTLIKKIASLNADMLADVLKSFKHGKVRRISQNRRQMHYYSFPRAENLRINWKDPFAKIQNTVLASYLGSCGPAYTLFRGRELSVSNVQMTRPLSKVENDEHGKIVAADKGCVVVVCADGVIRLSGVRRYAKKGDSCFKVGDCFLMNPSGHTIC